MTTPHDDMEPSAELRTAAAQLRQMYVALVKEGFRPNEAFAIVGTVLAASINGQRP